MALTVNTNVASLNAQRNLNGSSSALATSMERLSSGSKINSAKDDAAGLQISNRLTSQINGLGVAVKNANDGISIAQTAEGAMQETSNIMQRMRDLALQSANGSNGDSERSALQQEFTSLSGELNRISGTTSFGGKNLLDGSFGSTSFQIGSNANQTISFNLGSTSATALKGNVSSALIDGGVRAGLSAAVTGAAIGSATGTTAGEPVSITSSGAFPATVGAATTININGKGIDLLAADALANVVTKINAESKTTGVTAAADNGNLTLTSDKSFQISDAKAIGFSSDTAGDYVAVTGRASVTGTDAFAGGIVASTSDELELSSTGYTGATVTLDPADSLDDIVTRINDVTKDTGVTASNVDGKLKLESKGDLTVGAGSTAATLLGLTASATAIEAQTVGQAKVASSFTVASGNDVDTTLTALTSNTSITLNGTEISLLKGDDSAAVADRINNADIGIKAEAGTGGNLTFTSSSKITVDGEPNGLAALGLSKGTSQVATGNAEELFAFTAPGVGETEKLSINGKEISITNADDLESLRDKINAAGAGVTAEVVDADGKLKLSSANGIAITGSDEALDVLGIAAGGTGGTVSVKAAAPTTQFDGKTAKEASIRLNGEEMTIAAGSKIEDIAASINQNSDATKVTAEVKNGRLQLNSTDGAAIKLEDATAGSLAQLGLKAGTTEAKLLEKDTSITLNGTEIKLAKGADMDSIVTSINSASTGVTASKDPVDGSLTLFSDKDFSVADGKDGTGLTALGLSEGTTTANTEVKSISELDITSAAGAQEALQALDGALQQVDSMRAELGAVQNRFDSTVSNLQNISENASAARSRITDTDYAVESANLAKNQIMQQAGTAMLAQANQLPQAVLSLLQ